MLYNTIVVFDFETGSNRKSDTEIVQIGALAINSRNLTVYPDSEFETLVRPLRPDDLQEDALRVNKKTREELAVAPHPKEVWARFAAWIQQWNWKGKNDMWSAPIPAGHNIIGFDLPIYERYCREYGTTRTEKNGEVVPSLLSNFIRYDTMQLLGYWSESLPEPRQLGMDYLRKFFDMPKESLANGHDALQDVRDTAEILIRLLRLARGTAPNVIWKDCFNEEKAAAELVRRRALREKANGSGNQVQVGRGTPERAVSAGARKSASL